MAPFYPYRIPSNIAVLPTPPASRHCSSGHALHKSTPAMLAMGPTPRIRRSNDDGTSLSTPDIVGIAIALLFLFGGLAWFTVYALVTLPRRKKRLLAERRKRKKKVEKESEKRESEKKKSEKREAERKASGKKDVEKKESAKKESAKKEAEKKESEKKESEKKESEKKDSGKKEAKEELRKDISHLSVRHDLYPGKARGRALIPK